MGASLRYPTQEKVMPKKPEPKKAKAPKKAEPEVPFYDQPLTGRQPQQRRVQPGEPR